MTNKITMQEVEILFDVLDAIGNIVKNRMLESGKFTRIPDFETFGGYFMGVISDISDRKPPFDNDTASALKLAYDITCKKMGTTEQSRVWKAMAIDLYEQLGGR
jgi:hypothetical protein